MNKVTVFFYGSYINRDVLREVDLVPDRVEPVRVEGFDIVIGPLANLVRSEGSVVYGINLEATHDELTRLYDHARDKLGGVYLPEAVVTQVLATSETVPALCYVSHDLKPAPAANDYIDRILGPAREYGVPEEYCRHLESFRPKST